jgi:predicted outer membrane repeat protein
MCKRFLLIVLLAAVIFLQATIEVDDSYQPPMVGWGVTKFDNIQDALDEYPNGATIYIHSGTYQDDDVASGVVTITNPNENNVTFNLYGDSSTNTIIDGENERRCINIYSETPTSIVTVTVKGLKLINGDSTNGAGISASVNHNLSVKNCIITDNEASDNGGGICSTNGGECADNILSVFDSEISNNQAENGGGIYYYCSMAYYNTLTIKNSIIEENDSISGKGGGLYISGCMIDFDDLQVLDNEVSGTNTLGLGGGMYCETIRNNDVNTIDNSLFTGNLASTSGGAIYYQASAGADFEITNVTVYDNSSTNGTGGLHLEDFEYTMDILNCIIYDNDGQDQINNTGNGDVDITYSCIENGTTTNGNITSIPKVDDNNDCALDYDSPCIDTGNPSSTYDDTDGSRADMGWKYHEQDIYTWQNGLIERAYLWKSFPKLQIDPNQGGSVGVENSLQSWNPLPDELELDIWNDDGFLANGSYNDNTGIWTWNDEDITSIEGYKMEKDNATGCLLFSRGVICESDIELDTYASSETWLGYFLEESQLVVDAFPSDVLNDAILVKTMDWTISRNTTNDRWSGATGSCYINYADCVVIETVSAHNDFNWETPSRSGEEHYRPVAEHFTFDDDVDYFPIYAIFDVNDMPDEVAVYVDDVCRGAQVVEDTLCQICAHILEEDPGQEIEFAFWYEGRGEVERRNSYQVYDQETDLYELRSLITGMPGIHYEVSFKNNQEDVVQPQFDLNCYPNPFNPELTISFSTTESTKYTEITIFNVKGQKVKTLVSELFRPDDYNIVWKGDDQRGNKVSSGVYYVRLQVGEDIVNRKVIMMK